MIETKQCIQRGENLKRVQKKREKIATLTREQLKKLEPGRAVYQSVGRMFVLTTLDSEIKRHDDEIKKANDKIAAIDKQKEYLEKSLAESEKNLRELVQSRP
ncbi:unnamed protein product [Anisakis simplex]|uniref:Probable prefoldin subunit 1 (inferred by orthology to a C. elegans protein) n=1 Tax=Anisakis simplex TaxID=6269 RepID=A0A0M3KAN6_ANISI|nr:unnamed protein product [Anisakis simplex]